VAACPACGKENPDGFQFCGFCAARLKAQPGCSVHEERKVVTVLFCDLVGFTAASEAADPEDVRARLRPYHARLRDVIERFGGTVEKFVGDAVMAVFGAPVTHEDDAERAVRAGLSVLEAIDDLNASSSKLHLRVRVGINTGETLVDRAARPELGEAMVAGDAVNTAARLQAAAPVGGIAVGEATYAQTRRVFEYERLESVEAKGKTEHLSLWRPLALRARRGTAATRAQEGGLVGRQVELRRLCTALERTLADRHSRLISVVGEPGVGKSRLLAELRSETERISPLVPWRQGRCVPYGEGIAFWALGEIVKSHAGIYEADSAEVATEKLEAVLPDVDERPWLRARLLPLLGVDSGQAPSREESFTAWRRFLETMAEKGAVIAVEDLHWADLALLDFLAELAGHAGVPLLVVCTARPELYDRSPAWANSNGDGWAETLTLEPLSEKQTAELVSGLVPGEINQATQKVILSRAGGNPLYVEEIVSLLVERDLLAESPAAIPLPDALQALVAARLDTLPVEHKSMIQDAAVLGHVFWPSALASMGDRDTTAVERALQALAGRHLIRRSGAQSLEDEPEYAFWHIVTRDVAYAQISRVERVRRHVAAGRWIEIQARERLGDVAELIAYHYLAALDVARAADHDSADLEDAAIRYLILAAGRALALDVASAETSLAKALELTTPRHPRRALVLERWAEAAQQQGRIQEAERALEEAIDLYREQGERVATGRALTFRSHLLQRLGDPRREATLADALALLEQEPPGPELVAAYAQLAGRRYVNTRYGDAIDAADRALALARELGLDPPARALGFRGGSRACRGEHEGLLDMQRALDLAVEQGKGRDAAVIYTNLAIERFQYEGPQAAFATCVDGIEFSERRGIEEFVLGLRLTSLNYLLHGGHTDEALAQATESAVQAKAAGIVPDLIDAWTAQLSVLAERGRDEAAQSLADELIEVARIGGEPQQLASLGLAAFAFRRDPVKARALLVEVAGSDGVRDDPNYVAELPQLVRTALALGDHELAENLVFGVGATIPLHEHVLCTCRAELEEGAGDVVQAAPRYGEAVERWRTFGMVTELAYSLLGQGRSLHALGDAAAGRVLAEARDLFASMGYKPALTETEVLLRESEAAAKPQQSRRRADHVSG